jgi:3-deoxy-D-manno-octulosonic-acid transferase
MMSNPFWRLDVNRFLFFLYNAIGVPMLLAGFLLASPFSSKIRRGKSGRRGLFKRLEASLGGPKTSPRIWIHNSSMGEFEQAKPLIAQLRKRLPGCAILVTFFSPSGFEHARKADPEDILEYIPFDSMRNAKRFVSTVRPDVAVVIRHDFWPNHLRALRQNGVPCVLINASNRTRCTHAFFKLSGITRFVYELFDTILTVSDSAKTLFEDLRLRHVEISMSGDTRYDQVIRRVSEAKDFPFVKTWIHDRSVIVAGSTWPEDEDMILESMVHLAGNPKSVVGEKKPISVIMVPHEPTTGHLSRIQQRLEELGLSHQLFSNLENGESPSRSDVLIVDRIGILAGLYRYGEVAYVGGGFGAGIHSVLEPAAFGKPVIFGPRYRRSHEAVRLIERGAAFSESDAPGLAERLEALIFHSECIGRLSSEAKAFVEENRGASERIAERLIRFISRS